MDKIILIFLTIIVQTLYFFNNITILQNQFYSLKRFILYSKKEKLNIIRFLLITTCFVLIRYSYMYVIFYLISFLLFKIKLIKNLKITKRVIIQFIIFILCLSLNFLVIKNKYCYLIYNLFCYWISFAISVLIEKLKQKYYIKKAKEKLKNYKTKTIAITGSYGKTSCKNYIYEFLKDKYNVLISPHSYNTLNGMLLTINKSLKPYHNYLILEIGVDEKKGMNKFINNFSFDYCAVTCIGYQHLSTFKTIDNIAKEKCKLLNASTIMSIYNKDDFYISNTSFKENNISFSTNSNANIIIKPLKNNLIEIKIYDEIYQSFTNLLGRHNLSNLALSVAVCKAVGLGNEEIVNKIGKIKNVCHRLSVFKDGNWTIIDDSYNSNINGFINALDVLSSFDTLKIIITPGIIENSNNKNDNIVISKKINEVADLALLIKNPAFSEKVNNKKSFYTFTEAYNYLKENYKDIKLTILIENDLPEIYIR